MTRDEILSMPAGREMDALIAEKVMGIDLSQECDGEMYDEDGDHWSCTACAETGGWSTDFEHTINPKNYSTDIAAAWDVVEKLKDQRDMIDIWHEGWEWHCDIGDYGNTLVARAETAPLAICRAALLAVDAGAEVGG